MKGSATVQFEVGSWKTWGSAKRLIKAWALCKQEMSPNSKRHGVAAGILRGL